MINGLLYIGLMKLKPTRIYHTRCLARYKFILLLMLENGLKLNLPKEVTKVAVVQAQRIFLDAVNYVIKCIKI
jgi:hypothetical protein